ncbi:CPBP family intramembrane metalloprotease [Streptomyces sp. ISL-36]|uniref:CPBP family intramembrane glutamic endopeptidase n=1 Tax=Streptomyces sp. ISL-36 TaxID=2819182 RepID=UPI001BE770D2|nr:type II CAAX endopeptidase family protein [Streptomyces sp. ISL-36]MBT2444088.1 CPBP family intramembrane metalloprotease [Streptomyces sp. ISL-36]
MFLGVAFVAAGALGAVQPATGIPAEVVQLTQFGPAAGVVVAALLWPGRIRERLAGTWPARGRDAPAGRRRGLWLLLTAPLIVALAAGAYGWLKGDAVATDPRNLEHPFALVVVAQLVGACGEEIGWRCYLQPLLRTRFEPVAASVLVGAAWGVWHLGVFAQPPAYAAGFLVATVAMSVVLGLGPEGTRAGRLLLAGGFHTLVNLGMLLFMDEESGAVTPMLLLGAACLVATVPWVVAARRSAPMDTIGAARRGAL